MTFFDNWDIPPTHSERLALAWRECPFSAGKLSSLHPYQRRRLYARYVLPRTIKSPVDAAFLVHPRGMWPSDNGTSTLEEDISRHFPEWCAENFGITLRNFDTDEGRQRRHQLYRTMQANTPPGVVVGRYEGLGVRVLIIASNMVPEFMMRSLINIPHAPSFIRRLLQAPFLKDGQSRLIDAAIFAHEICGARILGLGAMNALATHFGQDILDCYQDVSEAEKPQIVTGHRVTTAVMADIAWDAIKKLDLSPVAASVGVIGAGSIGTAAALELVARGFCGQFVIYDIKIQKALALQDQLCARGLQAYVIPEIKPEDWRSCYNVGVSDTFSLLRDVDIVLAAPSTTAPYIWGNFFRGGVVLINDSQPPVTTVQMMAGPFDSPHPGGLLLEVLGSPPEHVFSTFNTGCPPGTDFTCAIETIVAAIEYSRNQISQNYSQRVAHTDIPHFYRLVQKYGFCRHIIYTHGGKILSADIWNDVKLKRAQFDNLR